MHHHINVLYVLKFISHSQPSRTTYIQTTDLKIQNKCIWLKNLKSELKSNSVKRAVIYLVEFKLK